MNIERLTKLRDLLLTVPAERFNMNYWGRHGADNAPGVLDLATCGTAGCAFGWACSIPEFREAGLRLDKLSDNSWRPGYVPRFTTRSLTVPMGMVTYTSYGAAEKFFDLSGEEAGYLFNPDTYAPDDEDEEWNCESITPTEVVERIDRLLRGEAPFSELDK